MTTELSENGGRASHVLCATEGQKRAGVISRHWMGEIGCRLGFALL